VSTNRKPNPEHSPSAVGQRYRSGVEALDRGRFEDAISHLKPVVTSRGPAQVLGKYYLSQAHMGQGRRCLLERKHSEAVKHFRAAQKLNPQSAELGDLLVQSLISDNRPDAAITELEKTRTVHGHTVPRAIRLALLQWRLGRREEAVATLEQARRQRPDDADIPYQLALMSAEQGQYEAARTLLQDAVAMRPTHARAHRHLGLVFGALEQPEHAAAALADAARLLPRDAAVALELATALRACDRRVSATLTAELTVPTDASADHAARRAAAERLGEVFASEPDMIGAFLDLPRSARDFELFEMLAAATAVALSHHPGYADLHRCAALIQLRLGRFEDAMGFIDRALQINPRYVAAMIDRGRILATQNRPDDAVRTLRQAVAHGGDYADVHFHIGDAHRKAGRPADARLEFHRALRINSGFSAARQALEALAVG
jgi:tetratricopeptide (TPR) repeat protein